VIVLPTLRSLSRFPSTLLQKHIAHTPTGWAGLNHRTDPPSSYFNTTSKQSAATPKTRGAIPARRLHGTSLPWASAIWNIEAQKGPPSKLSGVLPSPTTIVHSEPSPFSGESSSTGTAGRRDSTTDSSIPFAIRLHPTPKTYRSQSYPVGGLKV
jgi:hypothetical protein